jgi:uncharacterized membrane protein
MKNSKELLDQMNKNPDNWKGIFYFNFKDKRVIVKKFNPAMGWTFNFGNPFTYVLLFGAITLILAIDFLVK